MKPGDRLEYTYDFGDDWHHEVLVEEERAAEADVRYPRCLAGQAARPPEDVGGPPGYGHLIEVLADPEHDEHQTMLSWLELGDRSRFDPACFTPDEAKQRLGTGTPVRN